MAYDEFPQKHDAIMYDGMKIGIVNHQQSFQFDIGLDSSNCITSGAKFQYKLINMFLPQYIMSLMPGGHLRKS
jgi:hypothetical protein